MADFITGFTAYVNTGPQSQIAVQNTSDPSWLASKITFEFSESFSVGGLEKALSPGVYGAQTQVTEQGNQSFQGWHLSGRKLTWFVDMSGGDGLGWKLALGDVRGGEINGTRISVDFYRGDDTTTSSYTFQNVSGNGRSFNASVPEPGGLMSLAVLAAVWLSKFRRK